MSRLATVCPEETPGRYLHGFKAGDVVIGAESGRVYIVVESCGLAAFPTAGPEAFHVRQYKGRFRPAGPATLFVDRGEPCAAK